MPLTVEGGLIESARLGGADVERLIAAVWPEAYRIAFSILRDGGLAEDAAQDACAAMARSLPRLKNANAFYAWSYKIIAFGLANGFHHATYTIDSRSVGFHGLFDEMADLSLAIV